MMRSAGARTYRDAPALRFLLLCVAGWIVLRVAVNWTAPAAPPPSPWTPPAVLATARSAGSLIAAREPRAPLALLAPPPFVQRRQQPPHSAGGGFAASGGGSDRHLLRLALMTHALVPAHAQTGLAALPDHDSPWPARTDPLRAEPGGGAPNWMRHDRSGWEASAWIFLRPRWGAAPDHVVFGGQTGGSQAGLRVAHGLAWRGRARGYGRAVMALERPGERELALGVAFAPFAGVPVDFALEQRVAAGSKGRTALAAMVAGGVGDVALPAGFRLEAYAQAGVVGARQRDGFIDGAIAVDHRIGSFETSSLSLGALAAGAAQPDAARFDVGPRLTLRLPSIGQGSRLAIDWRQRIAGEALPESGVAVTLASDF